MKKKITGILAAIVLLLGIVLQLPMSVSAGTVAGAALAGDWAVPARIEPLFADILSRADVAQPQVYQKQSVELEGMEFLSMDEASAYIREQLKRRSEYIEVCMWTDDPDLSYSVIMAFAEAFAHTGEPTEGDYLMWHFSWWSVPEIGVYQDGNMYYLLVPYYVGYYTTAEQETEMDAVVDGVLAELSLDGLSDYGKVKKIYDYITANVTYDYEGLANRDDLIYTAYSALVKGKAVCQGYANLFYRLALEVGVDSRIITGIGNGGDHAWNMVELDGKYYYLDATWDASLAQNGMSYQYFLRGSDNFVDHAPSEDFEALLEEYPISAADYVPSSGSGDDLETPKDPIGPTDPTDPSEPEEPTDPTDPGTPSTYPWNVSADEWDVLRYTNLERHKEGLAPLTITNAMARAADIRAAELTEFFSHDRPDRSSCFSVLQEVGMSIWAAAENIAAGQRSAESVVNAWMNSEGHRANILDGDLVHLGVGLAVKSNDTYGNYWEQLFATGWSCAYTDLVLSAESLTVPVGTDLDDMGLWAALTCAQCGESYLPVLEEYCTGYDGAYVGTQTVTVSCLDHTATLEITTYQTVAYGDANDDGKVNGLDVILLRQYIAGWDVTVEPGNADTNGDGRINGLDMILLRQYIAGWDVTLGPN